jgi:hypothetical protein
MMALVPNLFRHETVANTEEVRRIKALPRRVWSEGEGQRLADLMTKELKTPGGTMKLLPVQAISLYELMEVGGLFGPQRVGTGKTLETALCPTVLEAKHPVLLLPASLIGKTETEFKALREHWKIQTNIQMMSYESLSLVQNVRRLDFAKPDLIIADEVHYLANHRSGRGRRIARYMREHPETKFVGVSGTVMKKSITDFGRILRWSLKENAPVPLTDDELMSWAEALDEGINPLARRLPGALLSLNGGKAGHGSVEDARTAFQTRLLATKGVVASSKTEDVECSILVKAVEYEPSDITKEHFKHVRKLWETPDEWPFMQATELRMYLRQLAVGFHGVWSPRPPPEWLAARKAWNAFAREILKNSHALDTPLAVANAIDAKRLDDGGVLNTWRAVEKTFKILPKPIWHDDTALNVAAKWAESEKGLIWVEHCFFGERLAKMLDTSYYGPKGLDKDGKSIKDEKGGKAVIASIFACKQGFNLQGAFSTNLFTSCPSGSSILEQAIGRTHRQGQTADVVTADILVGCGEQMEAFERSNNGARATEQTLGHSQKLMLADIVMPDISHRSGPLWGDDEKKECDCPICLKRKST